MPSPADHDALFLGIDFGTSGVRAVLIDSHGEQQAFAATALPPPLRDGSAVTQAPSLWLTGLTAVLTELGPSTLQRVSALAVDGTSATLLVCDAAGTPLAPALMYNDARAVEQATAIAAHAPADSAARGPGSSLAKLLWLLQQLPARPAHALQQADWVSGWLRGRFGDSDENNCLKLGYDARQRRWPQWLDGLLTDRGLLPRVRPAGTPIGPLSATVAERFGFRPTTAVVSGTTDSTAAFIATGANQVGDAVTTLGSTLVLKVLCTEPVASVAHGVYSHRLGELWLAGGASNSGGAVIRQHFDDAQMAELSRSIDFSRPSGLNYYPLCASGERFPVADPTLMPRLEPRPDADADFLHGLLEGIATIEFEGYSRLQQLGAPWPGRVFSSGGGAANRPWAALRQRLLGVTERAAAHTDAAYGAAELARRAPTDC